MPPAPVILLITLMIGYPLTQIIAIKLRRHRRLAFNDAVDHLLADPSLGRFDRNVVRRIAERSRGGAGTLRTFLALPLAAFRAAFEAGDGTPSHPRGVSLSAEIDRLHDQAVELEWATWPLTFAVVFPVAFFAWAVGAGCAWLRGAVRPTLPTLHDLARATASARASAV